MKRFVYKATFLPRYPQPHVKSDQKYHNDCEVFLVMLEDHQLKSFNLPPIDCTIRSIHISKPFEAQITEEQGRQIQICFTQLFNSLYYQLNSSLLIQNKIWLLPVMKMSGKTEWDSTMNWLEEFDNPITISEYYQELLVLYDKRNNGQKLQAHMIENGASINRFLSFICTIDKPIEEFIQETAELNQNEVLKKDLVPLVAATRIQSAVHQRLIRTKIQSMHYYFCGLIAYDVTPNIEFKAKKPSFVEYFHKYINMDLNPNYPMMTVIKPKNKYGSAKLLIDEFSSLPNAYSIIHLNFLTILERNKELIPAILRRIPDDFDKPSERPLYPLESVKMINFPHLLSAYVRTLNYLSDQLCSVSVGRPPVKDILAISLESISKSLTYRFKNPDYLRTALTDSSWKNIQYAKQSQYQRIEYLGDAILDICTCFPIFNANEGLNEGEMTWLKHKLVSNKVFARVGFDMGLPNLVISATPAIYTVTSKSLADVLEAIFGAIFRDSDLSECFRVFKHMVTQHESIYKNIVSEKPTGRITIDYIINTPYEDLMQIDIRYTMTPNHPLTIEQIRDTLGLKVESQYLGLYQLALTHSSAKATQSYDRLEYIGDIIIKFTVCSLLYMSFPTAHESGLTIVASYYKSNDVLGRASIMTGLAKIAYMDSVMEDAKNLSIDDVKDDMKVIHKLHGDLFESTTAAIAIEFGLLEAFKFVQKWVVTDRWQNRADDPFLDPKSACVLMIQKHLRGYIPDYHLWLRDGTYLAFVDINGYRLPFVGRSPDRMKSMMDVSSQIIDAFQNDPSILDNIPDRIKEAEDTERESFELYCNEE